MIKVINCYEQDIIDNLQPQAPNAICMQVIDGDEAVGLARLYFADDSVIIDNINMTVTATPQHKDILIRAMISRACEIGGKIRIMNEGTDDILALGFKRDIGCYIADADEVVFPCECIKD